MLVVVVDIDGRPIFGYSDACGTRTNGMYIEMTRCRYDELGVVYDLRLKCISIETRCTLLVSIVGQSEWGEGL